MKQLLDKSKNFSSTLKYCLDLSWQSSRFYTLILIGAVKILIDINSKAVQYTQSMHDEVLGAKLSLLIMKKGSHADLEYFDNPEYRDRLQNASRDAMALTQIIWNGISMVSSLVSLASARYTKEIYSLSVEQINGERKKGYLQALTLDKNYAQPLHLYHAGDELRRRYEDIFRILFQQKKKKVKHRTFLTGCLELLPEVVLILISIRVTIQILHGNGTIGDYSLYTGLAAQLWSSLYLFSQSVMSIYDNQLKIQRIQSLDQFQNHVQDNGLTRLDQIDSITSG